MLRVQLILIIVIQFREGFPFNGPAEMKKFFAS